MLMMVALGTVVLGLLTCCIFGGGGLYLAMFGP
jgi:hypothetical protein